MSVDNPKKKTTRRRCITTKEKELAESDNSSYSTELLRHAIALDARAKAEYASLQSHCTYCKTEFNEEKGKVGHKVYNRNQGARPVIYLCETCLRDRKRKIYYLGVV
jgi:hypothetical protein